MLAEAVVQTSFSLPDIGLSAAEETFMNNPRCVLNEWLVVSFFKGPIFAISSNTSAELAELAQG